MRVKKNREVNIFSASVVDLFASGLGVFLVVSIIALANQKKEMSKSVAEKSNFQFEEEALKEKVALKEKIEQLKDEVFALKIQNMKSQKQSEINADMAKQRNEYEEQKMLMITYQEQLKSQVDALQAELTESQGTISELKFEAQNHKNDASKGDKGTGINFNEFEVGQKIRLENVQFFPGTDRSIEPYASREISEFADFMKKNPRVIVEVSGHIFETKKAIQSGKADDEYNLSGKRARKVCEILVSFGIADKRLNCVGYGAQRYIHLTDDQYSKEAQENRRVEIEIMSK